MAEKTPVIQPGNGVSIINTIIIASLLYGTGFLYYQMCVAAQAFVDIPPALQTMVWAGLGSLMGNSAVAKWKGGKP